MKGVFALVALVGTTGVVRAFGSRASKATSSSGKPIVPRIRVRSAAVLAACLLFFVLSCLALVLDVPSLLQTTHSGVVAQKAQARLECRAALDAQDFVAAEVAIRNNTLSKVLYADHTKRARGSVDRVLRRVNNTLLFAFGVMWPAVPPIAAMILILAVEYALRLVALSSDSSSGDSKQVAGQQDGSLETTPTTTPTTTEYMKRLQAAVLCRVGLEPHAQAWAVLLPLVDAVLAMGWVAYAAFYLIIQERQVTDCMVISGHWFTSSCTFFALLVVAMCTITHALADDKSDTAKSLAVAYSTYAIVYVAMVLRVLINSQLFHHDNIESMQGVKAALIVMPFMAAAALTTLSFSAELLPLSEGLGFVSLESLAVKGRLMLDWTSSGRVPVPSTDSHTTTATSSVAPPTAVPSISAPKSEDTSNLTTKSASATDESVPARGQDSPARREPGEQASQARPSFLSAIASASHSLKPSGKENVSRADPKPSPSGRPSFLSQIAGASKALKPTSRGPRKGGADDDEKPRAAEAEGTLSSLLSQALNSRRAVLKNPVGGGGANNGESDDEWDDE
jgi:hypothetical protein